MAAKALHQVGQISLRMDRERRDTGKQVVRAAQQHGDLLRFYDHLNVFIQADPGELLNIKKLRLNAEDLNRDRGLRSAGEIADPIGNGDRIRSGEFGAEGGEIHRVQLDLIDLRQDSRVSGQLQDLRFNADAGVLSSSA